MMNMMIDEHDDGHGDEKNGEEDGDENGENHLGQLKVIYFSLRLDQEEKKFWENLSWTQWG